MGKPFKKDIPGSKKQKRPKNRQTKRHLIFDEQARTDYLTGFSKRKKARQKKAQEQLLQEFKEEKKRVRQEKREKMKKQLENQPSVPEVEHLLADPETYDLPDHTVTITDIADVDFVGSSGMMLGSNNAEENQEEEEEEQMENKAESEEEEEKDDEEETAKEKSEKTGEKTKKKKKKKQRHTNFSHLMDKKRASRKLARKKHKQRGKGRK